MPVLDHNLIRTAIPSRCVLSKSRSRQQQCRHQRKAAPQDGLVRVSKSHSQNHSFRFCLKPLHWFSTNRQWQSYPRESLPCHLFVKRLRGPSQGWIQPVNLRLQPLYPRNPPPQSLISAGFQPAVPSFGRNGREMAKRVDGRVEMRRFRYKSLRVANSASYLHVKAQMLGHREDILVAATTHVHHDDMLGRQFRGDLHHMGQRVAGFQCGNDTF